MTRHLEDHKVNPANDVLTIEVEDEPGAGGANHRYQIKGFDTESNASRDDDVSYGRVELLFQNGPINEVGVNGITHEALLAILADRLRSFQAGPYSCRENAIALTKIEEAQLWLQSRTRKRMARNVEGTHTV